MQDPTKLEKILKLLAQAESTTNEEEAKSYTERAQQIASSNSISLEMARAAQSLKEFREELTMKAVQVGEPGREHKNRFWVDLFLAITRSNDVRCTIASDRSRCFAYGYPSDIEVVEILFGSLNIQMVHLANESMARGEHRAAGVHGKTWRNNFYEGFVSAIETRLYKARNDAMREQRERDAAAAELIAANVAEAPVESDEPIQTGALVMAKKSETINDYYKKTTAGTLSRRSYSSYGAGTKNYGAQAAGRNAGQSARLGAQGSLSGGKQKQIG